MAHVTAALVEEIKSSEGKSSGSRFSDMMLGLAESTVRTLWRQEWDDEIEVTIDHFSLSKSGFHQVDLTNELAHGFGSKPALMPQPDDLPSLGS